MADEQVKASIEATQRAAGSAAAASSSVWERISRWAAENKTVVYTIAGVTLVATGAGVVYYVSGSGGDRRLDELSRGEQKKSKKERRKAKKEAQDALSRDSSVEATVQGLRHQASNESMVVANREPAETKVEPLAPQDTGIEAEESLPSVDESTVGTLSEQVSTETLPVVPRLTGTGSQGLRCQTEGCWK